MTLVIPPTYRAAINKYSGWLSGPLAGKSLKYLWRSATNQQYVAAQIYSLITHPGFVDEHRASHVSTAALLKITVGARDFLTTNIDALVEAYHLPYPEDFTEQNTIHQLHQVNLDFVQKTAVNLVQTPETFQNNVYRHDPDTGVDDSAVEYDFTAESWSDGTWHPEHLFTNSQRNRENPYWKSESTEWDASADATGLGHRYKSRTYKAGAGNSGQSGSQFPIWQTSPQVRPYERDVSESLRDGGTADRRAQRPSGYNMAALRNKSSYK